MALSRNKIIEILKSELPTPTALYGVWNIPLYGSYARDKRRSDIDILVDLKKTRGLDFIEKHPLHA
jgi:predicted nucleotidyltransferase